MRAVAICALALVGAGCGSESSSPTGTRRASAEPGEPGLPVVVLSSRAGKQRVQAVGGCVRYPAAADELAKKVCRTPVYRTPARYSVVRPGELITILAPGAARSSAAVRVVSCGQTGATREPVAEFELHGGEGAWRVDLKPGRYELDVFLGEFTGPEGLTGDGAVANPGLLVDEERPLEVLQTDCP